MKSNRESEHNVPKGLKAMERFDLLPLLREGVQVHYEGSIDKQGLNADWDWWLYREGEEWVIFDVDGPGCITAILAQWESKPAEPINDFPRPELMQIWICMTWDDHEQPDVECPLGAFFGNELGYNRIGLLSHGQAADGQWYQYFPMPYWQSARIELVNRGTAEVELGSWQIRYHAGPQPLYPQGRTGYFRSSDYYPSQASHGTDSIIGQIQGRGHLVAGQVTAFSRESGQISCEGDVRIHIDGRATPQVESDGSESWVNYGWGFPTPPEMNPSSGYDGLPDSPWSMVRLCSGDVYPFQEQLVFGIEAGEYNNQYLRHSGILLYYGLDEPGMELTDELDIGCKASEGIHQYRTSGSRGYYTLTSCYEGDQDDVLITDTGHETEGWSEFTVSIRLDNRGVRLRRRSDQMTGRQKATVHVDGILVQERSWYTADRNPYKRWLEDEYEIPAAYTTGKGHVTIRLDYVQAGETRVWNEFYYQVYSLY